MNEVNKLYNGIFIHSSLSTYNDDHLKFDDYYKRNHWSISQSKIHKEIQKIKFK